MDQGNEYKRRAEERAAKAMQADRERKRRKRALDRAQLIAHMAATIASGYAANPNTSGGNASLSRWSVDRAREILALAWEGVEEEDASS